MHEITEYFDKKRQEFEKQYFGKPEPDPKESQCSIAPWIRVTEQLPKHAEVVLIPYNNSIGFIMAQFMEHSITPGTNRRNFFCQCTDWGFDDCRVYYDVQAWLPIPKPKEFLLHPQKNDGSFMDYNWNPDKYIY